MGKLIIHRDVLVLKVCPQSPCELLSFLCFLMFILRLHLYCISNYLDFFFLQTEKRPSEVKKEFWGKSSNCSGVFFFLDINMLMTVCYARYDSQ